MLECRIHKARRAYDVAVEFVADTERLALFGPSGSGKSTVLSCLAGLETPDAGHIRCDAQTWFPPPLALHRRSVGYLSQREALFPHLSVAENVQFSLDASARAHERAWIDEIRERLNLAALWHTRPHHLSGGQARRVALARTLCRRPRLVLLDEPFAGLDRPLVRELAAILKEWQERLRFTLLAVDHDPLVLEGLCPRVIALEEGRVVQRGDWSELARAPATPTLRALLDISP
ncbi:ABC transporter ATP-binding protein [Acidiferrobacter sp. SPIII_3]|jgi:molybdate transport system ATP-binding protein|uniref:ATP-binding cassette domain-containing protein n=1 Tax=Acidiferrobacter sp. SPIII_3 TaxID=1281578 RepID=UPI000D73F95A|nr:ATP-binding cassette domain-containing protein [Acidiferrobacter sp. SPIII_3]AWP24731.1 ABC transporter ATP-binding protein [Acidiferrobacter sp. SPIII_3]